MAFIGTQEILLICFTFILLIVPFVIIAAVIYAFIKGRQEKEEDRIKRLEARIYELEQEKAREGRLNRLEKRYEEQFKK